jgi:hypothetical protein
MLSNGIRQDQQWRWTGRHVPVKTLLAIYVVGLCLLWGFFIMSFTEGILVFASPHDRHLQVLLVLMVASTLGMLFLVAIIGVWFYVYHDAGRRGMNQLLWVLIAIFTPNLLGIIIYLVVRKPLLAECPACRNRFEPQALYCPQCGHQFKKRCPACNAVVEPGYQFCSFCGANLSSQTA